MRVLWLACRPGRAAEGSTNVNHCSDARGREGLRGGPKDSRRRTAEFPKHDARVLARADDRATICLSGEHKHEWVRERRNPLLYAELAGSTWSADSTECGRGARDGSRHRQLG